ncbi:MAG: hypothetical protein HXS46_15670 [Theionarchaea archaeon]|nr:hypothetical protein [Theionarchaea archaeon]
MKIEKKDPGRTFICPVCGGTLGKRNLPDAKGVIDLEHPFDHYYNEEEDHIMDEPHNLMAVIEAEFDGSKKCTAFCVVQVYPG